MLNSLAREKVKCFLFLCCLFLIQYTQAQENNFKLLTAFKEFKDAKVTEITQDSSHNIWFTTNIGLLKFNGLSFKNYNFKSGKSSSKINTILFKNDSLFIGKKNSLHLKTRDQLLTFDAKGINKIFNYKNNYFIGSNQGILHFRKDYLQPLKTDYNLDFSIINDIIFYNNNFIVASNSGLWQLNKLLKPTKITQISKGNFSSLLSINKRLFVVKNNDTILELDTHNTLVEKYTKNNIKSIKNIQNNLYIISKNNGIDVVNKTNFIFIKRINKYNSNLNSNQIQTVFEDAENNIFIATENNIYLKKSTTFLKKPTLEIADITINYIPLNTINANTFQKVLKLETNQNNISFLLQSTSINNPKNIEFRYQLNDRYSPWSKQNQFNFANLNAGNYTFIAEARFKHKTATISKKFLFTIDAPIYKKTWFIVLSIIFLCLILAGIIDVYIRKLKKKNKQKVAALELENHLLSLEQKALQLQMNPHFIFNVLNGIKALGNSNDKKELNKTISQFSVLLRSVLNNARLEEISLQEEIKTLENYLGLEQKMSGKSFVFSIEKNLNNIDEEEILIPPMLLQPFVENAIKHGFLENSSTYKIRIIFTVKNRFLECAVIDNGVGIYKSQKNKTNSAHNSVALKITKERIENLSKYSSFSMEELQEKNKILGTKIIFKTPLKTDY